MEQVTQSIMVRSKMSSDEWQRFRVLALRQGEPTSELVGRLMRDYLEEHDPSGNPPKRARGG